MNRGFAADLQRITEEFERRAHTEPDIDFEIRDEFVDYDESDEEQIEKIDKKLEHYLEKKKKHEGAKGRLKLANEWGGIDHPDLEETVEQSIIESKFPNKTFFHLLSDFYVFFRADGSVQ